MQKYTYTPLSTGFFRLIKVVGGCSPPDCSVKEGPEAKTATHHAITPIRVECVECPFQDPVRYEALSYCWSGHVRALSPEHHDRLSQLDRKVFVSDGDEVKGFLLVTAALETALRYLTTHTDKRMFVDQLCINQEDNDEKNRLVRRMGEIYSNAQRVLSWLGPSTPAAENFVSWMKSLEENPPSAFLRLADLEYPILDAVRLSVTARDPDSKPVPDHLKSDRDVLREMVVTMWDDLPLRGFMDVCSRHYFGRMWIIQEACLPKTMQFVCGNSVWHADHFERTLLFLIMALGHRAGNLTAKDIKKDYPKVDDIIFAIAHGRYVNRIFGVRRTIHRSDQARLPFFHLLTKFNVADTASVKTREHDLQKFRAKNPRDCYYSLLGLPEATDTAVQRVVVSYEKTPQQVFTEMAEALLVDYTDVLLFSQIPSKKMKGLPSWVPDWSSELACPFGYLVSNMPAFTAGYGRGSQSWAAASGPRVEDSIMTVAGYSVDIVDRVGQHVYRTAPGKDDEESHFCFLSEIEIFCNLAREKQEQSIASDSPPCLEDAPWLMATGGRGLASQADASHESRYGVEIRGVRLLGAAYQIQFQYSERISKPSEATHRVDGWNLEPEVRKKASTVGGRLGINMDEQQGRKCFLTSNGYVGLGPLELWAGDVVVVLKGASVPMVLRRYGLTSGGQELFSYVGEAYCYGIMDGELLERRSGNAWSLFRLV